MIMFGKYVTIGCIVHFLSMMAQDGLMYGDKKFSIFVEADFNKIIAMILGSCLGILIWPTHVINIIYCIYLKIKGPQ